MVTTAANVASTTGRRQKFQQKHPYDSNFYLAMLIALCGIALVDLFAGWLYFQPFWANIALHLIGR